MRFGQLLFNQPEQMPISCHHVNSGLLTVASFVGDAINPQEKLVIAHNVDAVSLSVALPKSATAVDVPLPR